MSDLYWLTDDQMAQLEPYFPKSYGKPRVDDRRGVARHRFREPQRAALVRCTPGVWSTQDALQSLEAVGERGVLLRIMEGLAAANATPKTVMIDATYLKAHRTASSLRVKTGASRG